jgi:hypothetical protein
MHVANADGTDSQPALCEYAKYPASGDFTETEHSLLAVDGCLAHDENIASEQRFDLRHRDAVAETLGKLPLSQSNPSNCGIALYILLHMQKQSKSNASTMVVE